MAWQVQAAKERAEDEAAVTTADEEPETRRRHQHRHPKQTSSPVQSSAARRNTVRQPPAKDSPIAKQRAQIADFMKRHEQLAAGHLFATLRPLPAPVGQQPDQR